VVGLVVTVSAFQMLYSVRIMFLLVLLQISFVISFEVTLRTLEVFDSVFIMDADVFVQIGHEVC
jgi:hypothetical protein